MLYRTTGYGGTHNFGTIVSLSVGLGPFVETRPTSDKVRTAVKILGTDWTGATSVTFNGAVAVFTSSASLSWLHKFTVKKENYRMKKIIEHRRYRKSISLPLVLASGLVLAVVATGSAKRKLSRYSLLLQANI
ncbi:MAG: hypothetical protein ABSF64_15645 [Bryobacteraceae bacterium]|jgi:hypothetical protein